MGKVSTTCYPLKRGGVTKPENRPINPENKTIMRHIYNFIKHKVRKKTQW